MKPHLPPTLRKALLAVTGIILFGFYPVESSAATWIGTSNWDWATGGNWDTGTAPDASGVEALFNLGSNASLAGKTINVAADVKVGQLTARGKEDNAKDTLEIDGAGVLVFDNGAGIASLEMTGGLDLVIGNDIRLDSHFLLYNNSNRLGILTLDGAVALNGKNIEVNVGSGYATTEINGIISGTGNLTKTGAGTLILGGANTFTGNVSFQSGTIAVNSDAAFGAAANVVSLQGGAAKTFSVSGDRSIDNSLVMDAASTTLTVEGGGSLLFDGTTGTTFNNTTNTTLVVQENTTLGFGSGNRIASTGRITKSGKGELILGSVNNDFNGLTVTAGRVSTATYDGEVVVGSLSSGKNILGRGAINVQGTNMYGDDVILELNGGASSTTIFNGAVNVINGGTLIVNSGDIRLSGGTMNFGTGAMKGNVLFNGTVWLGSMALQNASGSFFQFSGDVNFLNGSTIAATAGLEYDFIGTGDKRINAETAGGNLSVAGRIRQNGQGTTSVGNIGSVSFGGLEIGSGVFDFGSTATAAVTGGVTLNGGMLAFGKAGQYAGSVNASSTTSVLNLNGFSQSFSGLNLAAGTDLILQLGGASGTAVTSNLGVLTMGSGSMLRIRDWTAGEDVVRASASDLSNVWFYGYNKGATMSGGVISPGSRLTVQFSNQAAGNQWKWSQAGNWRNTADSSIDEFNVPNSPGVTATFGALAGDLVNKTVDLEGRTWTVGTLVYNYASGGGPLYLSNGMILFDSGVDGTAAQLNMGGGGAGFQFNAGMTLNSDLLINTTAGWPYIIGGITATAAGTDPVTGEQYGRLIKSGSGDLRISGTGFGSFDRNIHLRQGFLQLYSNNVLGTGTIRLQGGGIRTQYPAHKFRVGNKLQFENNLTTYRILYAYAGDVDLGLGGTFTGTRRINVSDTTNLAHERASVTFASGFNFTGAAGLEKAGAYSMEMLSGNSTFSGGLRVSAGQLYTTLSNDMLLGGTLANGNYLGTGNITVTGGNSRLIVATQGKATTFTNRNFVLENGGSMEFEGGGEVRLTSGMLNGGAAATKGTLVADGDVVFGGIATANTPNIAMNAANGDNELKATTGNGNVAGLGVLTKSGADTTLIGTSISSLGITSARISAGTLQLGASNQISASANLVLAGGLFDVNGFSQTLGQLQLTANSGILLGSSGKLTFSSAGTGSDWSDTAQLNIQSSDTSNNWTATKYVRFIDASGIGAAQLANISFTGYESGAQKVNTGGFTYLTPTGNITSEWIGNDLAANWGTNANWLGGIPDSPTASASIRDIDANLSGKTILVNGSGYTLNRLNLESTGGQNFTIGGPGMLTFAGTNARIRHTGGNTVNLASAMRFNVDTLLDLEVSPSKGLFNITGTLSGSGDLSLRGSGVLRISGNNTGYTGTFSWDDDRTAIQIMGTGAASPPAQATLGSGLFQIGQSGKNYYMESYGTSSSMAARSGNVSTDYSLGGNLYIRKQTENGQAISEGVGLGLVSLVLSGDGVIESGNHVVKVWGNSSVLGNATEYLRLQLTGNLSGDGNITHNGYGRLDFYGSDNSGYTGNLTLTSGIIGVRHTDSLGKGLVTVNSSSVHNLRFLADRSVSLSNPFHFNGSALWAGNTIMLDYDGSATDGLGAPISTRFNGLTDWGNQTTVIFGRDHAIAGTGSLRQGSPGGYGGDGTTRFLSAGSTWTGGINLHYGTIQAGASSVWQGDPGGSSQVWRNGVLQRGNLVSGPIGTGTLTFGTSGTFAAYSDSAAVTAQRISNQIVLSSNTILSRADKAVRLIFDNNTVTLRNGMGDLNMSVASGAYASFESRLVDHASYAGGITKSGAGVLELGNANNQIAAGIQANAGIVRGVRYQYDFATSGTQSTGVGTGNVTIGKVQAGQNYLGTGVLYTNASGAGFEVLTTDGSTVTIARRTDGQDTLLLNKGGVFRVTGGTGVITDLENGLTLRATDGALGTFSSTGTVYANNLTLGVKMATPNFEVRSNRTVTFSQANLLAGTGNLTLNSSSVLKVGGFNQQLGGSLTLNGASSLDFSGFGATNSRFTLNDIITATGAPATSVLNIIDWKSHPTTGVGLNHIVLAGATSSQMFDNVSFGAQYTRGGVTRYLDGIGWVLTPMGQAYYWDGRTNDSWSSPNWRSADAGGVINPTSMQPITAGEIAVFGNYDGALNGTIVSLGSSAVNIGTITIENNTASAFTIGSASGPKLIMNGAGAATAINMASGSTANVTINSNIDLYSTTANAGTLGMSVNHNGGGKLTINGVIEGLQSVTKTGAGVLELSGASRFTYGFNLQNGSVLIAANGGTSSGPLGDGWLNIGTSSAANITLEASGGARTLGSNHVRINNDFNVAGDLSFNNTSRNGEVAANSTVTVASGGALRLANKLTGSGKLTKAGAGILELSGDNTGYAAGINVAAGTLAAGSHTAAGANKALGTAAIAFTGDATLTNNASTSHKIKTLGNSISVASGKKATIDTSGGDLSLTGSVSGAGSLVKAGANTLTLSGASTYSGGTQNTSGTLRLTGTTSAGTGLITNQSGAVIQVALTSGGTIANAIANSGMLNVTGDNTTLSGVISGAGANNISGTGAVISGTNTTTGLWTIATGGSASYSHNSNFGSSGVHIAGTLTSTGSGNIGFNHAMTGSGVFNIGNTGGYSFGASTGNSFAGIVNVNSGARLTWDANASRTLTNANLVLKSGSVTTMNPSPQSAKKLTLDGGRLNVGTGTVNVNELQVNTTGAQIVFDTGRFQNQDLIDQNILSSQTLIHSNTAWTGTGGLTNISLVKNDGSSVANPTILDITQGTKVAEGTYTNGMSRDANDLKLTYQLTAVKIMGDKTLELAQGNGKGAQSFDAKITGVNANSNLTLKGGSTAGDSLALTKTADHAGSTTITGGTIKAGVANLFAANKGLVVNGSVFDLNNFAQTVKGLNGAGGTIALGTSALTVNGGGTYAGALTGTTGSLTKTGAATLTLNGNNTYNGATNVNAGKLALGGSNTGTGVVTVANGAQLQVGTGATGMIAANVTNNGSVEFNRSNAAVYAGIISGAGTLAKTGAGELTLSKAHTFTGATSINGGRLKAGVNDIVKNSSSLTLAANTTFDLANTSQQVNNLTSSATTSKVTLGSGKLTANNTAATTFAGVISGTGSFDKKGAGILTLSNVNTFSGASTISGGTLKAGVADIIGNSSSLTLAANTTFDLAGTNQRINNLASGAATSKVTLGSGKLTANNNAATTFAGIISGTGSLDKTGTGVLTLSNANTYTGATAINGGILKAGANNIIAASSGVSIGANAELAVNGTTQSINNLASSAGTSKITLGANGQLTVNSGQSTEFAGVISGSGAFNKAGAHTLTLSGASAYTGTTGITGGLLKLTNALGTGNSAVTVSPLAAGAGLELAFGNATYANNIAGVGRVTVSGSNVKLGGTNTLSGLWNITGSAEASSNVNLGTGEIALNGTGASGVLNLRTSAPADWAFHNKLTGTGTMNVDLGAVGQRLTFGTGVGSALTGMVNMTRGTLTLDAAAAGAFANGTLKLTGTGNAFGGGVAEVAGTGTRSINNLTMAGGTLQINFTGKTPNAVLDVNTLDTTGGGYLSANGINGTINQGGAGASNFFDDSGNANRYQIKAVSADNINGNTQLVLVDGSGNVLTGGQKTSAINEGGTTTGTAYYDYVVTTGMNPNGSDKGVFIGYGLKRIDAASGQQVTLANGSSTGTLDAQLTGAGGFVIDGTGNVSIGNALSNYTGETTVNSGNVLLQTNNAFGMTGKLDISTGAAVHLQGNSQTIGQLDNGGTIALGNGTLTISNGGTSSGSLSGAGTINLAGGTLTVTPANTGLTANVNLTGNSTVVLNNVASLGNSGTLTIAAGSTAELSSATGNLNKVLAGTGEVALTNTGDVVLNANNTSFAGNFDIAGGTTLTARANMHLGDGTVSIDANGLLILNADTSWGMNTANIISGAGKVSKTGIDTLTINHANSFTGGMDITAGTVRVGHGVAMGTGLVSFTDDATLEMGANNLTIANNMDIAAGKTAELLAAGVRSGTLSGYIGGAGALAKSGTGTIILTGTNTFTGQTTILSGKLQLGNGGSTGSVVSDITNNAALEFNYGTGASLTYAGEISGTGTVAKTGAGALTLEGDNSYAGVTTVSGGQLVLTGTNSGAGAITIANGAALHVGNGGSTGSIASSGITNNGAIVFNRAGTLAYAGPITGTGTLEKTGSGILTLSGNNNYAGTTSVNGGTLVLTGSNSGAGQITIANGTTLQLGTGGTSGMVVANMTNNGTLVVDRSNADTYNGVIGGSGFFIKNGAGLLTLGGNSSYTGNTSINAGGLKLTHHEASGTGGVSLAANTGLELAFSNAAYDNDLTGTGKVTTTGSNISVTADNNASGFAGSWDVKTGSSVNMTSLDNIGTGSATVHVDGTLNLDVNNVCCIDRILSGSGDVNVSLGSAMNALTFNSAPVCSSFTGNMKLESGYFELGNSGQASVNAGAMGNATLVIGTGNTTRVNGDASIGGLTFDGGTLDLAAQTATNTARLSVNHLDVESGTNSTVNIDASQLATPPGIEPTVNFLDADNLTENGGMKVLDSASVSSEGKHLGLTVNGNASPYAANLVVSDGTNHDIVATYDYVAIASRGTSAGEGAGLYVDYVLTQLETVTNLILSNGTANDSTLAARLTGSGDLTINDSKSGIILTNNSNDYTGITRVVNGKLVSGVDEALGDTTGLDLAAATQFDLNGYTQTIDGDVINNDGRIVIGSGFLTVNGDFTSQSSAAGYGVTDLGTGTLKLNGGGTINGDGALKGEEGSLLHVDPSDLVINGANVDYKGDVLIDQGSSITLDHVDGLGNNAPGESGSVEIAANSSDNANGITDMLSLKIADAAHAGEFSKHIKGDGLLHVDTVADVIVNNDNEEFEGETEVEHGRVVAGSDKAVGTSRVRTSNADAAFVWKDLLAGSVIVNNMEGDGTVLFDNATARITGSNQTAVIEVRDSVLDIETTNGLGSASSRVDINANSEVRLVADNTVLGRVANQGSIIVDARDAHVTRLDNSGTFAFGTPGSVTGDFKNAVIEALAGAGTLVFNVNFAELTPDLSTPPSGFQAGDHLTVTGSVDGTHTVVVKPVGALPESGNGRISLITTQGFVSSSDSFKLPTNLEGRETVDIGSYAYTLRQGDGSDALPSANDWYLVGDSLSKQAEAVMGTAAGMGLGFHNEMDALIKRMGDLRLSQQHGFPARHGIQTWVRTYGWETNVNSKVSGTPFREYYYGADTGFDKAFKIGGGYLYTGVFVGMGESRRSFNGFGKGDTDSFRTGVYGAYVHNTGWYLDFVAKMNRYDHTFNSISTYGDRGHGEYDQYAMGFSVEAGKQYIDEKGWFAEPQIQFSYGWIEGSSYTTDGFIPVDVRVGSQNTFQARAGGRLGKNINVGCCTFQPYVKGSAVGMWSNGGTVTTSDGMSRRATMDGARMEIGAGIIWETHKYGQIYVDYEYVKAQRFETPWKVGVGYRVSF